MVWYRHLYTDESLPPQGVKCRKIKWRIMHNAGTLNTYVITLASNPGDLLDIISTVELMQKHYPKKDLFVVGLARGQAQAQELACRIVLEVHSITGNFDVKTYLRQQHRMGRRGRVQPCP